MDQMCESMDKNRIQGVSVGRAGDLLRSPYPSKIRNVDPAAVHGKRLSLPQEICAASLRRPDHRAEVSRGHIRLRRRQGFQGTYLQLLVSQVDYLCCRLVLDGDKLVAHLFGLPLEPCFQPVLSLSVSARPDCSSYSTWFLTMV
jgi:hypothetical protein